MKITITDDNGHSPATLYLSDEPTPEDVAALLIQILPAGQGKSLLGAAQRRALVERALEALAKAGA